MDPKDAFIAWRRRQGLDCAQYMDGQFTPSVQAVYREWETAYRAFAVPDLLTALKATVANCSCEDGRVWRFADEIDDETGCYESCPRCSLARAAIAKVEGR